jgi:Flp pilus assembly protein TadG
MRRLRQTGRLERGQGLIEVAVTLPILLLVSVGIFEFGRAFETWQILINAAREGARVAVLPDADAGQVEARARSYMNAGLLSNAADATVTLSATTVDIGTGTSPGSQVTIDYPFNFMVLNPVARLVSPGSTVGASAFTMTASAVMRNESP